MLRADAAPAVGAIPDRARLVPRTAAQSQCLVREWLVRGWLVISASCCSASCCTSHAIAEPTMSQCSFLGPLSILAGDATRNVGGSTGSGKMGDGLAHFKTARLCSITAALSNTMVVV